MEIPSEQLRITALEQAVELHPRRPALEVLHAADIFLRWLVAGGSVAQVLLYVAGPMDEDDDTPPTEWEGPATMAGMNTGQKIHVLADPEDAAGFDVDVPVTFTIGDENVATLAEDPDNPKGTWVISGSPGSTVLTVNVTKLDGTQLAATLAIDVVTADVAVLTLVAGAPVPE